MYWHDAKIQAVGSAGRSTKPDYVTRTCIKRDTIKRRKESASEIGVAKRNSDRSLQSMNGDRLCV
jgi:hypothetical protein